MILWKVCMVNILKIVKTKAFKYFKVFSLNRTQNNEYVCAETERFCVAMFPKSTFFV